ncbi:MAG: hypothetical protein E7668_02390 [Ruminococcaceae bacterium]|nr:hypothetical protein [Oscillospiraceae bacterium]
MKKIYVGVSYNEVMNPETPKLYGTYGVFEKDGDLYICADNMNDLTVCVTNFLASISTDMVVKDANGKNELMLSDEMLFLKEPQVSKDMGTLLGASFGDYRIVIPEGATPTERYYAQTIMEYIRGWVYMEIAVVSDAAAPAEREIVIGNTARTGSSDFYESDPDPYSYAIKSSGDDLYIGYTDTYCLVEAVSKFRELRMSDNDSVSIEGSLIDDVRLQREQANDVRIVTANVLTMTYCEVDDPFYIFYEARMELTAKYFNMLDADFIGAQECQPVMQEAIDPYLDEKYAWVDIDISQSSNSAYLPVLYNAEKWQVEASGADQRSSSNVGNCWSYVWVTFSRIDNPSETYTLMNLHYVPLEYTGRSANHAASRVPLAEEVNAAIKAKLQENQTAPVFVTGDYNCQPGGDVYEAQISGITMDSTYHLTTDNNSGNSIDNICVTTNLVDVIAHRVNKDANRPFMSDHAYHYADVRLK